MTHADPQIETSPRHTDSLTYPRRATHAADRAVGTHHVVSSLPPWPPRPASIPASLRWRSRLVEYGGLAVATLCFAAAICAAARAFFLAEEHRLGLTMFAMLAAVGGGFTWLGCRIVQAIGDWLERARALGSVTLSSAPSARPPDSDPSPRPRPRDSRC